MAEPRHCSDGRIPSHRAIHSAATSPPHKDMRSDERQAMIGSMIEAWEAKLADNPDNVAEAQACGALMLSPEIVTAQNRSDRAFAGSRLPAGSQKLSALAMKWPASAPTLGGVPMTPAVPAQDLPLPKAVSRSQNTFYSVPHRKRSCQHAGSGSGPKASPAAPGWTTKLDIAAASGMSLKTGHQ